MQWSDLCVFLAIARESTLAAAARADGQSQPTMGCRLRALEQDVGQTLFQRPSEGFVLTDEGAAVLAHAERMEEEACALEREMAGQDHHCPAAPGQRPGPGHGRHRAMEHRLSRPPAGPAETNRG